MTEEARPDVKSTRFKVVDGLLIAMMILPILACIVLKVLFTPGSEGVNIAGALVYWQTEAPLMPLYISESQADPGKQQRNHRSVHIGTADRHQQDAQQRGTRQPQTRGRLHPPGGLFRLPPGNRAAHRYPQQKIAADGNQSASQIPQQNSGTPLADHQEDRLHQQAEHQYPDRSIQRFLFYRRVQSRHRCSLPIHHLALRIYCIKLALLLQLIR